MRAIPLAIAVLVSCVAPSAPAALASATVALPNPSALRATLESRFAMVLPAPAAPGSVWSPDQPLTLAPRAFGLFPVDRQPGPVVTFDRVRLGTSLPPARPDAAVALVGSFDEMWKITIARVVPSPEDWDFLPLYASLSKARGTSLGPITTWGVDGLTPREACCSGPGYSSRTWSRARTNAGAQIITFIRRLEGLAVYTNKGVALLGLTDGGTSAMGRRRPILALSRYPIRTPGDAWAAVQRGEGRTMYVDDGAPLAPVTLPEFVVTNVELVYLEVEVLGPRELMQPYYGFRESGGSVLYVPAVVF